MVVKVAESSVDGSAVKDFLALYHPQSADRLNVLLTKYIPELEASSLGQFPMPQLQWESVDGVTPEGDPCFIPAHGSVTYREDNDYNKEETGNTRLKKDYVFGQGARGFGHYHLLTREAYANLNHRTAMAVTPRHNLLNWMQGHASKVNCETEIQELYDVNVLMYHRSHSPSGPGESTWNPHRATQELNRLIKHYVPEVDTIGLYPMTLSHWTPVDGTAPDHALAFQPYPTSSPESAPTGAAPSSPTTTAAIHYRTDGDYSKTVPTKTNYVFGTGPRGWGYYHITTRHAWELLTHRLAFRKTPRADVTNWLEGHAKSITTGHEKKDMDKLAALLYRRSHQEDGPKEHN